MIGGNAALRELARLKLRGAMRRQLRRLKKPSGFFFALVGALLSVVWISSLVVGRRALGGDTPEGAVLESWVGLGIVIFGTITCLSALSVRGVYLPRPEIERFFSAPVTRADLVRYRIQVDLVRSLFGALILGLLTLRRLPVPAYGFFGAALTVLTLGLLRQTISLLMGDVHSRLARFLKGRSLVGVRILMGIIVWFLIMSIFMGRDFLGTIFGGFDIYEQGSELLVHPGVRMALMPTRPWVAMMTATDLLGFLRWGGACLLLWLALYEFTARLKIDYREQSLDTSETIARRLRRLRKGGPLSGGRVSTRTTGWRIPWIFGRGALGAVAWVKLISVVRKARGTLIVAGLIVLIVTVGVSLLLGSRKRVGPDEAAILGSALITLMGIMYMSGALRFDFRSDLDRMVQIKAWPLAPAKTFIATLLPQVILISGAPSLAIWGRLIALGSDAAGAWVIPLVLPFLEFAWLSVDNIVYLFAPVRFVPGQEGTLHHTGRAIVLFLLRMILLGVALALVGLAAIVIFAVGPDHFGMTQAQAGWVSAGIGALTLIALDVLLAWIGGRMLRRFDVARDRA